MTGIYVRVNRNGIWLNVEVEHLTNAEREQNIPNPAAWLNSVCRMIVSKENKLKERGK